MRVWNAQTGKTTSLYQEHESVVTALAWSSDGNSIVSGGGSPFPLVHIWEKATGRNRAKYRGFKYSIRALAWLRDNQTCLIGSYHEDMRLWNPFLEEEVMRYGYSLGEMYTREGIKIADMDYCVSNVALSSDEKYLAVGVITNGVSVWDVATGENVVVYPRYSSAVAWSPDGTRLACVDSYRNTILIWQWQ